MIPHFVQFLIVHMPCSVHNSDSPLSTYKHYNGLNKNETKKNSVHLKWAECCTWNNRDSSQNLYSIRKIFEKTKLHSSINVAHGHMIKRSIIRSKNVCCSRLPFDTSSHTRTVKSQRILLRILSPYVFVCVGLFLIFWIRAYLFFLFKSSRETLKFMQIAFKSVRVVIHWCLTGVFDEQLRKLIIFILKRWSRLKN